MDSWSAAATDTPRIAHSQVVESGGRLLQEKKVLLPPISFAWTAADGGSGEAGVSVKRTLLICVGSALPSV